jgi:hypothetical protein
MTPDQAYQDFLAAIELGDADLIAAAKAAWEKALDEEEAREGGFFYDGPFSVSVPK